MKLDLGCAEAWPLAQVENFQRGFLLFGAVFVVQAVCILTGPSRFPVSIPLLRL